MKELPHQVVLHSFSRTIWFQGITLVLSPSHQRMSLSQPQAAANSLLPQLAIDASKSWQSSNASVPSMSFADSRLWKHLRAASSSVDCCCS
ncbi:hypothetical protein FF2_040960 [Malus domestica]